MLTVRCLPRFLVLVVSFALGPLAQADGQQLINLQEAIESLDRLIIEPAPADLSKQDRAAWDDQTAWLRSVRDRYAEVAEEFAASESQDVTTRSGVEGKTDNSLGGTAGFADTSGQTDQSIVVDLTRTNRKFLALQNAVQQESRKYSTLSNMVRARHDVAMSSINNIRQ